MLITTCSFRRSPNLGKGLFFFLVLLTLYNRGTTALGCLETKDQDPKTFTLQSLKFSQFFCLETKEPKVQDLETPAKNSN